MLLACPSPRTTGFAIEGVTIVDVEAGELLPDRTVLVTGNRIAAIGPRDGVRVPAGAEVVEANGQYLIPGLWDMHVHSVRQPAGAWESGALANADWHFPLFLAHGVTGVRNMNDSTADVTLELTRSVRRRLAAGELEGPRLLSCGPCLDGDPPFGTNPVVVRTAEEARRAVDDLADAGADFLKPYENLSREAYFAILERAAERGLPVDGHVPFRVTPEEAARAGQRTVEHPESLAAGCSASADRIRSEFSDIVAGFESLPEEERFLTQFRLYRAFYDSRDPSVCDTTVEHYRRHGVAVTADLTAYHGVVHAEALLSDDDAMRLVPPAIVDGWKAWFDSPMASEFQSILRPVLPIELENVRKLDRAGVTLLAGTDVGVPLLVPGLSLHQELERYTEAGLTPLAALRSATLSVARVLDRSDDLGTIEAGKLADLVLLRANPLEDIRNTQRIEAVVADGRLYRREDLDRLVEETVASYPRAR